MNKKYNKMILVFFMCLIFLGIASTNIKIFADATEEWIDYQIDDINLYNQTNTYDYNAQSSDNLYNLDSKNGAYVSSDDPQITIFTHGLGASAADWSNKDGKFTYQEDSLITQLRELTTGPKAKVYWYYMTSKTNLKIIDIGAMTDDMFENDKKTGLPIYTKSEYDSTCGDIKTDIYGKPYKEEGEQYQEKDTNGNYRLEDTSLPIIILFDSWELSDNMDGSPQIINTDNDSVYKQFNYVVSKAIYDFKFSHNGILPRINLIGHSRGGIINMMYALDHPDLVDSIFSMGTPYLGSTTASIDANYLGQKFCPGCEAGENDIINSEKYHGYRDRWNNNYDSYYSDINVYAIGSYSTLSFVKYYLKNECIYTKSMTESEAKKAIAVVDAIGAGTILVKGNIEHLISRNLIQPFISDLIMTLGLSCAADDVAQIFLSEMKFEPFKFPFIYWENDGFVNLSSQLGEAATENSGYTGFIKESICFTKANSDLTKIAQDDISIVHNLETRDDRILAYILKNIKMQGKDTLAAFTFGTQSTTDGTGIVIKSILKNIDDNTEILEIPSTINGKSVVEIGEKAFANNFNDDNNIKYVVIPSSVTTIGKNAFGDCENLERIIFSGDNNLEDIENMHFIIVLR